MELCLAKNNLPFFAIVIGVPRAICDILRGVRKPSIARTARPQPSVAKIAYLGDLAFSAQRCKYSGVLRYAENRLDWTVQQFNLATFSNIRRNLLTVWKPDALIVSNPNFLPFARSFAARRNCPLVALDIIEKDCGHYRPAATITPDEDGITKAAADFFISRGFRSFAYVGYLRHNRSSLRERLFGKHLADRGFGYRRIRIPKDELPSEHSESHSVSPDEGIASFIQTLEKPCAVLSYWDVLAKKVLDICRQMRVKVPEQVAVIGIDNDEALCERLQPTLSSIDIDFEGAGFLAAKALDELMQKKNAFSGACQFGVRSVVERRSTQDMHGSARLIAAAQDIIRNEATFGLRTAELARRLHVSQRILELRYSEVLGHTPHEGIQRAKLSRVCHLLRTTTLSLSQVAERCGYADHHLKVLFKARFGVSMRQWRTTV